MPEHIRAMVFILVLATPVFIVARRQSGLLMQREEFGRRRNLWYLATLAVFLSGSFWLYVAAMVLLLAWAARSEDNPVALFFMLMLAAPEAYVDIPGFGLVNYLFALSPQRLLVLMVLLPALLRILQTPGALQFGRVKADLFVALYALLVVLLNLRASTVTDTARLGFYQLTDVLLPYFVASRLLGRSDRWTETLFAFVLPAMVLAPIAAFEAVKHWLLYETAVSAWGVPRELAPYIQRSGLLRATGSTGGPIALGFVMAVAIGLTLYLKTHLQSKFYRRSGILLLGVGIIAALSRGPWVGTVASLFIFIATGRRALRRLMLIGIAGVFSLTVISFLPGGQAVVDLIPFIGETERETIDYREQLIENSMQVIKRNFWLGSADYLSEPEMEAMRQGQGIIDIVNTYIQVLLETGVIGLALFLGVFGSIGRGIYRFIARAHDRDSDQVVLARAILAMLAGIMVTILTVSSVNVIPLVYWSMLGVSAGFLINLEQQRDARGGFAPGVLHASG